MRVKLNSLVAVLVICLSLLCAQGPQPKRKKLLALGDVRTGFQHDSVSHSLAVIERLGYESGIYDTYIRTDYQLVTKQPITAGARTNVNGKNLNDFDAIFFNGTGNGDLTDQQKKDLISFIRDDGKGYIGAHGGDNAFYDWPEFGEMVGGYFDDHPWGQFEAPIIVEDPDFPAMKMFPRTFTIREEIYQHRNWSRDKVRVLMRLDAGKLDLTNPKVHRTDKDFAVAWAKKYGKGRVFCATFGHSSEAWDNPDLQRMWLEAIKWAMGLTGADVTPRPAPAR